MARLRNTKQALAKRFVAGLALGVVFVAALLLGVAIHLDMPPVKRWLLAEINERLDDAVDGRIVIERVGNIGWNGVRGVDGAVYGPTGNEVARIRDAQANLHLASFVVNLVFGGGSVSIPIDQVRARYVAVSLESNANGDLELEQVLRPPRGRGPSGPEVTVTIDTITVDRALVRGRLPGAETVNVLARGIEGRLATGPRATRVEIARAEVIARSLPRGAVFSGTLTGSLKAARVAGGRASAEAGA